MELARFFGFLHPALIHFPLVLLLVSVGLEAIGFFRRDPRLTWAAQITLILGTVATLFAFVAGNFAEVWAARDGVPQDPMEYHELLATITSWSFVFLTAGRLFMGVTASRKWMAVYLTAATAACAMLIFTGHWGAMLVYEHGAGVHAAGIQAMPTHEDLAILRQKQDPDALFYSNQMHHIFGWMVLILSLTLLVDMVSPRAGDRLRRFTPVLLLAGGIFLMIFSDQDAWPLYNVRPFRPLTDKEVLMHKTYAILMLFVGIRGLWRRKGSQAPTRQMQSRMMAIFALVGGALLFTHVHSNAPYANVAAGVYIHHTVMGLIALSIGAVKLLEDILLQRPGAHHADIQISTNINQQDQSEYSFGSTVRQPSAQLTPARKLVRGLGWAYPCLMLIESIFLLNYNEGLPWFLGYRDLSLSAPHKGLIAPLGKDRAELCYDPATQRLDLYLLQQANDKQMSLPADSVQSIIKTGSISTSVDMTPVAGDNSHYSGRAPFLRGAPMFETQAYVWQTGHESTPLVADFEPWIDETLSAPHTRLAYVCPMHDTIGASAPGVCSICGMQLVPNRPARPWNQLHDDTYHMDLVLSAPVKEQRAQVPIRLASAKAIMMADSTNKSVIETTGAASEIYTPISQPLPGQKVRLKFTLHGLDGKVVRDLAVVHTKKLHLIVASKDLSFFDHIHPEVQPDGSLTLDYIFPRAGDYLLYADLTPLGDRNQVFRIPVTVSGTAPAAKPLFVTPAQAREFGDYRIALTLNPDPPVRKDETQVSFTISENGVPVNDIEPFLGAGGHCVILSADTLGYLHSHPLDAMPQASVSASDSASSPHSLSVMQTHYGPTITFHTLFPRPGIYKIWGQFLHHGKPLTADFVVKVK